MKSLQWLENLMNTKGLTPNAVAEKAGITPSTIFRQIERKQLTMEAVLAIARSQEVNPVTAFRDCGFFTEKEVADCISEISAIQLTDMEIARELLRRASVGNSNMGRPLTEVAYPDN